MWVIHIILGGGSWMITVIFMITSNIYHTAFFLVYEDPEDTSTYRNTIFILFTAIVIALLAVLAHISEKKDKINFLILRNSERVSYYILNFIGERRTNRDTELFLRNVVNS